MSTVGIYRKDPEDREMPFTKREREDFPGGPVDKTPCSQWRGPGSIIFQGTRSLMLQLRPGTVKQILKKTLRNIKIKKKEYGKSL